MMLILLWCLLLLPMGQSVLFEIPVALDNRQLPPLSYDGGRDPAIVVANYMQANNIKPEQALVNALNNRLIRELKTRSTAVEGKAELFRVPFKLQDQMLELPIFSNMSVLLLASHFCVENIKILDVEGISVAQCCETVIKLTDDLHDNILSTMKAARNKEL